MELTAADIADDLNIMDNLQTVTVRRIDGDTGDVLAESTGVTVLRSAVEIRDVPVEGGGEVKVTTCRWHLKASQVSFVPKKVDRIVDADGKTWVIDDVTKAAFQTKYICGSTYYPGNS